MPIKLNWDNFSVNHSEQNIYVTVDQTGGDLLIATVGPDIRTFTDVVDRSPTVSLEYAIETVGIKQGILTKAISDKINIPIAKPMIVRPSSNTITIESLSPLLIDWGDGEVQVEETINATSNLDIESGLPTKIYTHTFTDGFEDKIIKISHFDNASPIRFFTSDAIKEVVQWYGAGYDGALTNLTEKPRLVAFYGLGPELIRVPDVGPKTTIYAGLFENARIFNQPLDNWDTSLVTSMYGMFKRCLAFNQPLDSWDVSNVQDFSYMFEGAIQFNQNLPSWSTGNATDMSHMFAYAEAFDGEIGTWDISNVKTLRAMFKMCYVFNQPLNGWDTSNVTDLTSTFSEAGLFNQPLNDWDTSKVTSLKHTFNGAYSFNQPLSNWITNLVESMAGTFKDASSFDQNIHGWSVKNIANLGYRQGQYTIDYAEFKLNCPLRHPFTPRWGTENPRYNLTLPGFQFKLTNGSEDEDWVYIDMMMDNSATLETVAPYEVYVNGEFYASGLPYIENGGKYFGISLDILPGREYNVDIRGMVGVLEFSSDTTGWWPSDETNPEPTPLTATMEIQDWGTKENISNYQLQLGQIEILVPEYGPPCSNYNRLFNLAAGFNDPNISLWDTSHVTDMSWMFTNAINFNQPVNNWNTSNVTNFFYIFAWCHAFNQPLNNWDVSNATDMGYMFCDSYKFNSSVDGWTLGPNLTDCHIFADNYSFNLPIDSWDLTQAKTLNGLFSGSVYNQPLNGLNVSNIENMSYMFSGASAFNQPLDQWDVSNVTDMHNMFHRAEVFNQPIGMWDVSKVTTMYNMFLDNKAFNQDIGMWDVSNVVIMESMFESASVFNQYLGTWDTRNVNWGSRFYKTFGRGGALKVENYPNWSLGPTPQVLTTEFSPEGVTPLISIITTERPSLAAYFKDVPSGGIIVDWGDGIIEKFVNNSGERLGSDTGVQTWTHQYQVMGEYTIKVYPLSKLRLLRINGCCEVSDWGNIPIDGFELTDTDWSMDTSWLRKVPTYLPGYVVSTKSMFHKAITFNDPSITSWDVSNVTDMAYMFHGAKAFNQPIGNWNTSTVTNMSYMFSNAFLFNQPLNNWDTSNVKSIEAMFYSAKAFNQPIDQWDVSKTTSMFFMFHETLAFDQPLNTWDVSNVTRMTYMFRGASSFNQPLDQWNVGNVTDMGWMFDGASLFDQDISSWDMRKVKTIRSMFYRASRFNKPVNSWKLLSLTDLIGVFQEALLFNQPLDQWDTSKITAMNYMFRGASSFNQDIGMWDMSNVTDMYEMFYNASSFNQDLKNWCVNYFTSIPSNFVTNATNFLPENLPVWGTCPLRESNYIY